MSKDFLSKEDEQYVIASIKDAELATSGEVRVHIEKKCSIDPIERAKQVFAKLKMHRTQLRNGVILYIATEDHKIVIWGDEGIHKKVGQDFWDDELEMIVQSFKEGNYGKGIGKAISDIGQKLKEHFPYQDDDVNELLDDISYGDDHEK